MAWMRHQPKGPLQVDASNPLTRGLQFMQSGISDGYFAGVNGPTTDASGIGISKVYASAQAQYMLATDDKIKAGSLTFLCLVRASNLAGNRGLMSIGANTNDRTLLYSANSRIALFSGSGSTTGQAISPAGTEIRANTDYILGGRVLAVNSRDVWVNGARLATSANSVSPQPANRIAIGAVWSSGAPVAGQYFDGAIQLALAWNRALTDDEMRQVSANPWQLFLDPEEDDDFSSSAPPNTVAAASWTEQNDAASVAASARVNAAVSWSESAELMRVDAPISVSAIAAWNEGGEQAAVAATVGNGANLLLSWTEQSEAKALAVRISVTANLSWAEAGENISATARVGTPVVVFAQWVEAGEVFAQVVFVENGDNDIDALLVPARQTVVFEGSRRVVPFEGGKRVVSFE